MKRRRFALCGLSTRGLYHFALPLLGKNDPAEPRFTDCGEPVGILDTDRERVATVLRSVQARVPYYPADALARMIRETAPDVVIAAGPDGTHCEHIVGALEHGGDAITEKPMVINCEQVRRVWAAERASGRQVIVALNYRYTPTHQRLKRMILEGELGRITNIEFTYNLDTWHGSSYFYRWNRYRDQSGGLSISKGCHHFDLLNRWLDDLPEEVFAYGALNYYGPHGALRPRDSQGRPLPPADEKRRCPVFQKHYAGKFDPASNDIATGWDQFQLSYPAQYPPERRRYIYDDDIAIEDTYSAVIRYRGGASVCYSCNFCTPWEGYILGINGTAGRVEIVHHSNPDPTGRTAPAAETERITYFPLFGGQEVIEIPPVPGGHGGADLVIRRDLLDEPSAVARELRLVAGSREGAYSVAVGEAVWRSIQERRPVAIANLLAGEA